MKNILNSILILTALISLTSSANDSIVIPVGRQSGELRQTISLPEFGQSMQSVEELLGSPEASDTIGNPAITKWRYRDVTVYFEDNTVLRTVVHFKPDTSVETSVNTPSP